MNDFKFSCPSCGQKIAGDPSYGGRQIAFQACLKPFYILLTPRASPLPPAVPPIPLPAPPAKAPRPARRPPPAPPPADRLGTFEWDRPKFPPRRAAGKVHGLDFKVESAKMENGILTIRQGKDFFAEREMTIFLFLKPGESVQG